MHDCPECGLAHEDATPVAEPEPVVVETGPNENDVEIAAIEAETAVKVAKIEADAVDDDLRAEVENLRGEMRGMREMLERLAPPEPEPEPVVVPVPEPAPAEPEVAAPPEADNKPAKTPERRRGFF